MLNGAKEMKRKIVIIGYDSGKQQKAAIRDGSMAGAITQNPVGIGYKTVEAAVKALKGEKLPKVIDTGFYWYDKTNIDDPEDRRGSLQIAISGPVRRRAEDLVRTLRSSAGLSPGAVELPTHRRASAKLPRGDGD